MRALVYSSSAYRSRYTSVALLPTEHQHRQNAFVDFRVYTTRWIAIAGILLLVPFSVNHLIWGRFSLGLGLLAVVAILCYLTNLSFRQQYSNWSLLLFPPILLLLALSVKEQGVIGVMWSYPGVVSFYFLFRERWAWVANAITILVVVPLSAQYLETDVALRAMVTLTFVSMFSILAVRVIGVQQQRLEAMAVTDALTGLLNRALLDPTLEQAASRHQRTAERATLLAIDIDHFKNINDTFGHMVGDDVLVQVAALLKSRLRGSDVVFRTGGEEFAILLADTAGEPAHHVAQLLRSAVAGENLIDGHPVTMSVGVAELLKDDTPESWFARADRCLYEAKRTGRNRVVTDAPTKTP